MCVCVCAVCLHAVCVHAVCVCEGETLFIFQ